MGSRAGVMKVAAKRVGLTLAEYEARLADGQKWCTQCKAWHPLAEFGRDPARTDGYDTRCLASRRLVEYSPNYRKPPDHTGLKRSAESCARYSAMQIGSRNHRWKGGITPEQSRLRQSPQTRVWRIAVFIRDNHCCQRCDSRRDLRAHHIYPWADYPDLRWTVENGITLCATCHKMLHDLLRQSANIPADWPEQIRAHGMACSSPASAHSE